MLDLGEQMADVTYSTVPGKITTLLGKIRGSGVPKKADGVWLKAVGLTSSNDRSLLPVLKKIDFVDASGSPTARWRNYRGSDPKGVLAQAIKDGYVDLYEMYDDAHDRPQNDVGAVFRTKSDAGEQAISKAVGTFKALVAEADFSKVGSGTQGSSSAAEPAQNSAGAPADFRNAGSRAHVQSGHPNLHIDLQVHISPEATPEQIDKIFASMAKHLYGRTD